MVDCFLNQDRNVDVIYVSPIELNEETLQYYSKLFALRTAVKSGNPKDLSDVSTRYKIVIPEALNKFPVNFEQTLPSSSKPKIAS